MVVVVVELVIIIAGHCWGNLTPSQKQFCHQLFLASSLFWSRLKAGNSKTALEHHQSLNTIKMCRNCNCTLLLLIVLQSVIQSQNRLSNKQTGRRASKHLPRHKQAFCKVTTFSNINTQTFLIFIIQILNNVSEIFLLTIV